MDNQIGHYTIMTEEDRITVRNVEEYIRVGLEMMKNKLDGSYPEVIIVEHEDLDTLVRVLGGQENIPDCKIYTDDAYTRGNFEYNLILFPGDHPSLDEEGGYGVATQIGQPTLDADSFIDLTSPDFEYIDYCDGPLHRDGETSIEQFIIEINDDHYQSTD